MAENMNKKPAPVKRGHGPGSGEPSEKPKNFSKSLKQILRYSGSYKYAFVVVILFAIAGTVFQVIGPKVMGRATTVLAEGLMHKIKGTGTIDFTTIGKILVITVALYAIGAVLTFIQGWIMTGITQKIVYNMRRDISEKINRMPMKYFESHQYGDILSRITNDVDTLGTGLNQSVTTIITSVATVIGVVVMMLTISPLMTLISFVTIPVSILLLGFIIKMSQKHFKTQQEYLGDINGQIEENFAGQLVIKAFNKEESVEKKFNETNEILYESAWKSQFISGVMQPVMMFFGNLGYVGVAISGAMLAIKNVIGIGDIQAFIQYVRSLTQPLSQAAQVMNQVQSMGAAGERVFEFLAEEEEPRDPDDAINDIDVEGFVEFEHVKFGYDPDQVIINDFSARVKPGQKIAIVGPTGAGKTTIVKLLMRFYDVNAGSIKIDDLDIRTMSRHGLRDNIAMVLQDTWLYSDTIMENIRYGKQDASDEEVIAAAKAARADRFIKTLPGGYNMVLNEDATNISEGQKQLLTIARAILANRKLLILDEATSSVDTRTEVRIQEAMDQLMKGRTTFVIAHRLSTIRNADLILVMNHGDIIEQGTHDELLREDGAYAELYNSQFDEVEAS
ncbi:ABC transporter ATP-binding protein [Mogibacterium neglectum]|uniref:ABC transporter ATP-binding protein n=1 Tax=Mogibacterium neglectum TaxID=114528 RepID=UPI00272CAC7E|nr:ABC transporter ATP-binding protein [Mogibacterium neglectum]WLD75779.1 ABC transporter ATP-binding protein [Mogibacterium neglectum]